MKNPENKLKEYLKLLEQTKVLNKKIEELRAEFKEEGTFSTKTYICLVTEQERQTLGTIAEFEKKLGKQILVELELIKTINYKVVKVGMKSVPH